MSNKQNIDHFLRSRLQNFEVESPKDAFSAIRKKVIRRQRIKQFYVGMSIALPIALIVAFTKLTNSELMSPNLENTEHITKTEKKKAQDSIVQNSNQHPNKRIVSSTRGHVSENDQKYPRMRKKSHLNGHLEAPTPIKTDSSPRLFQQSAFQKPLKKQMKPNNNVLLADNSGTKIPSKTQNSERQRIQEVSENHAVVLRPLTLKTPNITTDVIDTMLSQCTNTELIGFKPQKSMKSKKIMYGFRASSSWNLGEYDPIDALYDASPDNFQYSNTVHEQFNQHISDFAIRLSSSRRRRVKLYWLFSVRHSQEKYVRKTTSVVYRQDSVALNVFVSDSLSKPTVSVPNSFVKETKYTQDTRNVYIGVSQGMAYHLLQGKKRSLSINLEGGIHKYVAGKVVDRELQISNLVKHDNHSPLLLNIRTSLELHQSLSEHWSISGGFQVGGFWEQRRMSTTSGLQFGVYWR